MEHKAPRFLIMVTLAIFIFMAAAAILLVVQGKAPAEKIQVQP